MAISATAKVVKMTQKRIMKMTFKGRESDCALRTRAAALNFALLSLHRDKYYLAKNSRAKASYVIVLQRYVRVTEAFIVPVVSRP